MKINAINSYKIPNTKILANNTIAKYTSIPILKSDTISFSGVKGVKQKTGVDISTAKIVANSLANSTSGHRAPYGGETFNKDVVKLITLGAADYAKEEAAKSGKKRATVLIGGDTRPATRESLPLINDTLLKQNVDVIYIQDPVPSPLLALAAKNLNADIAVLMTASHNPWSDGGYNFITKEGAVAPKSVTQKIADNIVDIAKKGTYVEYPKNNAKETDTYPLEMYKEHINSLGIIGWDKIRNANIAINYDALKGTGSYVLPKLLNEYGIKFNEIHSSGQEGPNPTDANLTELKQAVTDDKRNDFKIGIANDGDADRFGIINEKGEFIPANDVLLLVSYHLAKNKGLKGTIIRSQATTKELDNVAKLYGIDILKTPVGFKYIAKDILDLREHGKDMLIAGEESGGLTVHGHIPEKDGVLADLLLLDLMATENKPLSVLLKDIKDELPIHLGIEHFSKKYSTDKDKQFVMNVFESIYQIAKDGDCKFGKYHTIDSKKTVEKRNLMKTYKEGGDGVKLFLTDGSTVLVRKSGTEPLLRGYIEAAGDTQEQANENCKKLKQAMDILFSLR